MAIIYAVFLISLTTDAVYSLQENIHCPPQKVGDLCTCKHGTFYEGQGTKVVCRDITDATTLHQQIAKYRFYEIDYLLLLQIQVPYLPAGLFLNTSVKVIIIKDSIIDNLYSVTDYKPSPFDGLENSLEELYIYSTKDPSKWYWPTNLRNLKKMKKIEFNQSPIDFIGHVFAEMGEGSLESITATYSRVYRIHPQAFPELTNLKDVDFSGNFLPYMVRTMFPNPAPKLTKINLSYNRLFTLPEDMFENMPALEYINLSDNEFKTFQEVVFKPVWNQLQFFFISGNPFQCGCHLLPLKMKLSSDLNFKHQDLKDVKCIHKAGYKRISLKNLGTEDLNCY